MEENELLKQKVAELETSLSLCSTMPSRIGLHKLSELQPEIEELAGGSGGSGGGISGGSAKFTSSQLEVNLALPPLCPLGQLLLEN